MQRVTCRKWLVAYSTKPGNRPVEARLVCDGEFAAPNPLDWCAAILCTLASTGPASSLGT